MIVGFYPGAGGNRFFLYETAEISHFEKNKIYDKQSGRAGLFGFRYLNKTSLVQDQEHILTHCMNVPLLKQLFPDQKEIVIIVSDLYSSLRREWQLLGRHKQRRSSDPVEDALACLSFHHKYYTEYPFDLTGCTKIVNIDTDQTEFAASMREEFASIVSEEFDLALEKFSTMPEHNIHGLPGDKIVDGYKSKFLYDAESIKHEFDKLNNKAICLAKWKQVSLHLPTGLNNSCYHPPLHVIPVDQIAKNPSALHNTAWKKEQRRRMLNGDRPEECSYCWAMEDNGKLSDRFYRSAEPWAYKDFGEILSSNWDDDFDPSYVEVNFNNACNLRCSYCSPQFSSSWADEVARHGGYPTSQPHNDPSHFSGSRKPIPVREHNPYVEAFWQWWPQLYPQLQHFRMTGGEPLMDKNTYRVFDWVLAHPKADLHLNVTSNFSVEPVLFDKYIDYVSKLCDTNIEHFMQYVSLDSGIPSQAEYIRFGLDFERMKNNVERYLTDVPHRNSLTFIVTMNNLSVTGLEDLMAWILDLRQRHSKTYQRIWFDTPVLRQPAWQSLQILPEAYVSKLESVREYMLANMVNSANPLHGFKDFEVQRLERDIVWMRQGQQRDNRQDKADFYRFFAEHDRRRGTNFLSAFPEMQSWWAECEYHARTT